MTIVAIWIILLLSHRDVLNISRSVVTIRVFIQHWQLINILRYEETL